MRLIDVLRQQFAEMRSRGLRTSAWKLDSSAIAQLRREAASERADISDLNTPPTFLGVPIEEVPMSGAVQADYVAAHCRFAPCQRLDRPHDRQWDIFDLTAGVPQGSFFRTKEEAHVASIQLDLEAPRSSAAPKQL